MIQQKVLMVLLVQLIMEQMMVEVEAVQEDLEYCKMAVQGNKII